MQKEAEDVSDQPFGRNGDWMAVAGVLLYSEGD